jgi:hypothetical protein
MQMNYLEIITQNQQEFLKYLKSKLPLFHKSNVFLEDLRYGVKSFLKEKNKNISFSESEKLVAKVIEYMQSTNIFIKIDDRAWMLNYPEFTLPKVEKTATVTVAKI